MKRLDAASRVSLILGTLCLLIAIPLFSYIAKHPEFLLQVEENQPSRGVVRGREFLAEGKVQEAIQALNGAIRYFSELVEEKNLFRHKSMLGEAYMHLADIYARHGSLEQQKEAFDLYRKISELSPDLSHGQPYVDLGRLYMQFQEYEKALESFERAKTKKHAAVSLQAVFLSGEAYFQLNQPIDASEAFTEFLRFSPNVSEAQWQRIGRIAESLSCNRPDCRLLEAALALEEGDRVNALPLVEEYIMSGPDDRFAQYIRSVAGGMPLPTDLKTLSLYACFPPQAESPYRIVETILSVYVDEEADYQLTMELSGTPSGTTLPLMSLSQNNIVSKLIIYSDTPTLYSERVYLYKGRNLIYLRALPSPDPWRLYEIFLHSLDLRVPENT